MKQEIDNNAMWATFRQELALQGELQVVSAIDNALNDLGFTIEETSTIIPIPLKQGEKNLSTDFSDLRTWKYIVDAVWTEKEGIGQYLDSPFTEETAKKLQKRFGNIEQKPAFCHHEVDFSGCSEEYRKAYYDGWNNCNQQHDQLEAEQKPAWSEEDDDNIMMIEDRLSDYLDYIREDSTLTKFQKNCLKEKVIGYVNWLKSLKERIGE